MTLCVRLLRRLRLLAMTKLLKWYAMTTKKHNLTLYRDSFSQKTFETEPSGLDWLKSLRRGAYERFKRQGFPTRRTEDWKHVDLEPILGASFVAPAAKGSKKLPPTQSWGLAENEIRLVFLNGVYSDALSHAENLPAGVVLQDLATSIKTHSELVKKYLVCETPEQENAFSLINTFSFKDGAFLNIPDKVVIDRPIHLLFLAGNEDAAPLVFYPRILILAGICSRVRVMVQCAGLDEGKFFNNLVSEVHVGEGACLDYFQIQNGGRNAIQIASNHYTLGKYSSLETLSFAKGGLVTRSEERVRFKEEGGFASLKGLNVLRGGSQAANFVIADHKAARCTSRQFYKNVLAGKSKSEFNSLVYVHPDAQKSDTRQLNRNLLLSDFAEAHTRPQLKIDTDDVACTHGATVGQLEKDELFYLQSRGLSKEAARLMLTDGFAKEVVQEIEPAPLKHRLEDWISRELAEMAEEKED